MEKEHNAMNKDGGDLTITDEQLQQQLAQMGEIVAARGLDALAKSFLSLSKEKGFWDHNPNSSEKLMLIVTEISEVVEHLRGGTENEKSSKIPDFTNEEEEVADAIIRMLDYASARGLRIGQAVIAKHNYNKTRPHKHGKNF